VIVGALAMASLSACGGGGGSVPAALGGLSAPAAPSSLARAGGESAFALSPLSAPAPRLYVGNVKTNTITVYDVEASGNVAPERTIGGSKTGITCLRQSAVDSKGYVYVANFSTLTKPNGPCQFEGTGSGGGEILVFAPGATGNVAPVRKISGSATRIDYATAVAVDSAGTLYVGQTNINSGNGADSKVLRFAPGASGDVAPTASAALAYEAIDGLTLDPVLGLISSSAPGAPSFGDARVHYFSTALVEADKAIDWDDPGPLASDPTTHTFLGVDKNYGPNIDRYADGTAGAFAPPVGYPVLTPPLVSSFAVKTCPLAVAIDVARTIFVTGTCPSDSITAYNHDSTGHPTPVRTIAGSKTLLADPAYVTVGP
jgi:hypothetical protein